MWTCPECDTNVNDESLSCEVCGARKPLGHDQTLFSSPDEPVIAPATGAAQNGFRHDLAAGAGIRPLSRHSGVVRGTGDILEHLRG